MTYEGVRNTQSLAKNNEPIVKYHTKRTPGVRVDPRCTD